MTPEQISYWFDPLFTTDAMRAVFSDRGRLHGMLDFEAALARAEAAAGVIPEPAAGVIASHCRAELFDTEALARAGALAGNSAIPVVRELTAIVGRADPDAARYVHWGATSQDAMDTGLVVQLRSALDLIDADLGRLSDALATLAKDHKLTPLSGRTWLQHATPVTFGLKAAGWLGAVERHRARIRAMRPRVLALQFGGAAGTLDVLGEQGLRVAGVMADDLQLTLPDLPWHAHRDRPAEVAAALGLLVGTLGKVARDVSLMGQTEVGELAEPGEPGRGGSSAMPHKRNPVGSAVVLAAAARVPALVSVMLTAMVQDHERGLGGWHAEWETLPEICILTAGALAHLSRVMACLEVHPERMRENLGATHGLILAAAAAAALGRHLGRQPAHELVERACRRAVEDGRHLRAVLAEDPEVRAVLTDADLDRVFDAGDHLGLAGVFVDRVLANRAGG
ncbi:MAG TPA: 3-carboxy-cis,cis-muconate cycloisomerase [Gemmataceae bacterium]|nr:3-carboxy-cis,cis-muconate cycloisomerase [Gemmataceae bacterium]